MAYAYGYQPLDYMQQRAMSGGMAGGSGNDPAAEMHERSLQNQEQKRRMYDSETSRVVQQQKYGLLGGLLGGGGMVGMRSTSRRFGDTPASERRRVV